MRIVEKKVSAGDGEIFDLNDFLARPLYAHLAHNSEHGPRESPVWFHWDGQAIWIIGGTSFPSNLKRDPRCALGIVDWDAGTGLSQHVGLRGRAEILPFDAAMARTIFRRYFGPHEDDWDRRFDDVFTGELGLEMVHIIPETVVIRDQSYKPTRWARQHGLGNGHLPAGPDRTDEPSSTGLGSAMANAYRDDLAYIHDAGFGGFARGAAALLLKELHRSASDCGLVIDLGCGSGILAEQLTAGGFDVLGIDLSAALIALARNRVPSGQFRVESLLTAELPRCVAVAAVGECVNYLFDDRHSLEGVQQVLGRAFAALVPGGLLVFDVAEPGRVAGGSSKSFKEGEGWAVLVTAEEDSRQELVTRRITSFRSVGELYRRDHEVHRLRLLPRMQVLSWLQDIGFQVETLDGYGSAPFSAGLVGFLARKPR